MNDEEWCPILPRLGGSKKSQEVPDNIEASKDIYTKKNKKGSFFKKHKKPIIIVLIIVMVIIILLIIYYKFNSNKKVSNTVKPTDEDIKNKINIEELKKIKKLREEQKKNPTIIIDSYTWKNDINQQKEHESSPKIEELPDDIDDKDKDKEIDAVKKKLLETNKILEEDKNNLIKQQQLIKQFYEQKLQQQYLDFQHQYQQVLSKVNSTSHDIQYKNNEEQNDKKEQREDTKIENISNLLDNVVNKE